YPLTDPQVKRFSPSWTAQRPREARRGTGRGWARAALLAPWGWQGGRSGAAAAPRLGPDLAAAVHDVLVGDQGLEAHRPAGVELLGADADLGAEPELEAVVEARGGVHEHGSGVDLAPEALGAVQGARDDRLAVARAVAVDVLERRVERGHDPDGQHEVEELGLPVGLGGGEGLRHERARALAAAQLHAGRAQLGGEAGQQRRGLGLVDEQGLGGVAHAGPLHLGVEHDAPRRLRVGAGVDVDVAVADAGLDHGYRRVRHDVPDQP